MDFLSAINLSYNFIISQLEFEDRQIIVYGYSFGSGPSIYLVLISTLNKLGIDIAGRGAGIALPFLLVFVFCNERIKCYPQ